MTAGTARHDCRAQFLSPTGHADVCALIVAYNSAEHIGPLLESLRGEAAGLRLRVVVVDNGSTDSTGALMASVPDVVFVPAGRNWGYSAAINIGRRAAGSTGALLVLNPDVVVHQGAVAALLAAAQRSGVSVPLIRNEDGSIYPSIRREPSVLRALCDALWLHRLVPRKRAPGETVRADATYSQPASVDWATGAAVMIESACAERVGDWDERFFLYSEEVDYCRRVRDAGSDVAFEPRAVVTHRIGGSGTSTDLEVLMAVNRVRYFAKYHKVPMIAVFRMVVAFHHGLRAWHGSTHRACLRAALTPSAGATALERVAS